jgi:hypothetical protein
MLKNVKLIMKKNGEKINARLLNISDSDTSPVRGVLSDVEVDTEKRNKMQSHSLRFDLTDGEKVVENCRIFNIDGRYIKFISS